MGLIQLGAASLASYRVMGHPTSQLAHGNSVTGQVNVNSCAGL